MSVNASGFRCIKALSLLLENEGVSALEMQEIADKLKVEPWVIFPFSYLLYSTQRNMWFSWVV